MALPTTVDSTTPAGSASPSLGDDQIRAFKLAFLDILGIPDATSITAAAFDIDAGGLAQIIFYDPAVTPASGELGRNGSPLYYRITDARTATVLRALGIIADTSGTPAAGIGTGILLQAESGDEAPSDVLGIDGVFTDVGAGTEDSVFSISLRVAGRALDEKWRLASTSGDGFMGTFTHANTADRTYTLPDADATLGASFAITRATQDVTPGQTTTSTSYTDLATTGPAVTLSPGGATDQLILISSHLLNDSSQEGRISVAIAGAAAADVDGSVQQAGAGAQYTAFRQTLATSVANGSTHTMKYRCSAGTTTFANRRINAITLS